MCVREARVCVIQTFSQNGVPVASGLSVLLGWRDPPPGTGRSTRKQKTRPVRGSSSGGEAGAVGILSDARLKVLRQ